MVTDVAGPSPPIITNLTCKDEQSIYLQWDKPDLVFKTIDYYYIYYRNEEQWQFKEVAVGMNGTTSKGSKVRTGGYWKKVLCQNILLHALKMAFPQVPPNNFSII